MPTVWRHSKGRPVGECSALGPWYDSRGSRYGFCNFNPPTSIALELLPGARCSQHLLRDFHCHTSRMRMCYAPSEKERCIRWMTQVLENRWCDVAA
jgi:hypothetical protein